jgi:hypothetical protein
MKNIKLLTACLGLLAGFAFTASCATNGVVLGQNFQSVIDASAPGDTLIVQPGIYPDASLVFNKPLTVLPSGTNGDMMQFLGAIQVTGAGASSFQRAYFMSSVQTTGSTVSFFDTTFNGNVTVTGGKVTMKRTALNYPLTLSSNAALEALRMTNNATVTATATVGANTPFLAVQSQFFNTLALSGYTVWLGYNNFYLGYKNNSYPDLQEVNCNSVLIGNKFSTAQSANTNVIYESGGTLKAYNNLITTDGQLVGIYLDSAAAEIANNTIFIPSGGTGIQANGGGPITLRGDIVFIGWNFAGSAGVRGTGAASQALFVSYCDLWIPDGPPLQGVTPPPVNCLIQVDPNLAGDGSLNAGSPCINAGPPDAIYNNRDGTRNSIGYTGGPFFNPANYTNNNPMVFLLTGQQTVLSGVQTNIQVNAAASAGH